MLRGDFGYSRTGNQPVVDLILHRLPATAELALWSVIPIIGVGVWLGIKPPSITTSPLTRRRAFLVSSAIRFPFVFGLLVLLVFYAQLNGSRPAACQTGPAAILAADFTRYT